MNIECIGSEDSNEDVRPEGSVEPHGTNSRVHFNSGYFNGLPSTSRRPVLPLCIGSSRQRYPEGELVYVEKFSDWWTNLESSSE